MEKRRYRFWDPKANVNIVEISNELYVIFLDHFNPKFKVYTCCYKVTGLEENVVVDHAYERTLIKENIPKGFQRTGDRHRGRSCREHEKDKRTL